MKLRFITLTLLAIASSSCDKAKDLANKTKSAIEGQIARKAGESGGAQADPALQKLVDETAEGVVFRKDLPFPGKIEVRTTRRHELSGRFFEASAIESHAKAVKGTQTTVTKLERAGNQVRYTLEQSTFAEPVIEELTNPSSPSSSNWPHPPIRGSSLNPAGLGNPTTAKASAPSLFPNNSPRSSIPSSSITRSPPAACGSASTASRWATP